MSNKPPIQIQAKVIGVHDIAEKLRNLNPTLEEGFRKGLVRACLRLQKYVKGSKLSGQVLRNQTGTLRRSIFQTVTKDSGATGGWVGKVGTNVNYGAVHEFGGTVNIKAHLRTITKAFGKTLKEPVQVRVRAHSVTYPERSFLRTAYEEQRTLLLSDMKAEIALAVRKP